MDGDEANFEYASGVFEAALNRIDTERQQTEAEIESFRSFETDVEATSTAASRRRQPVAGTIRTADCDGLQKVRTAYRDTVMAVSHYETEYGDTCIESLRAEFGIEVAAALAGGEAFDACLKRMLLSKITEAIRERRGLLSALERERGSLVDTRDRVTDISAEIDTLSPGTAEKRSFGALDAYRSRLAVLRDQCETLAETRQETLADHRRRMALGSDGPDVQEYLYRDFEASYPVLSVLASLSGCIIELKTTVERAMCHAN